MAAMAATAKPVDARACSLPPVLVVARAKCSPWMSEPGPVATPGVATAGVAVGTATTTPGAAGALLGVAAALSAVTEEPPTSRSERTIDSLDAARRALSSADDAYGMACDALGDAVGDAVGDPAGDAIVDAPVVGHSLHKEFSSTPPCALSPPLIT